MRSKKLLVGAAVTAAAVATTLGGSMTANAGSSTSTESSAKTARTSYVVLGEQGASKAELTKAVRAAGGSVVSVNEAIGLVQATSTTRGFATKVGKSDQVFGAATDRSIGKSPKAKNRKDAVERENLSGRSAKSTEAAQGAKGPGMDPLDSQLWGLRMVNSDDARKKQDGKHGVTVGILDTGLDATQPDLAPNFNRALSRNFATDMTDIDGPCEVPSCTDPVGTDDGGHGTHVAGTVAAAANGFGISGVAPGVSLVELKGGQDSGYFFLGPTVSALTYAGDAGIDVVNMSFYVDPWLYNCTANPADSAADQGEQRTIIAAMNRALDYAHENGVTLVGSLGNNHEDLGHPRTDTSSPDYPAGAAYPRPIDNATCVDLPVEGNHVIGVSALGPSEKKADYSNYGVEQISVSAPGGWFRDGFGTPTFRTNENMILSTYPKKVLQEEGQVDEDGNITPDGVALGTQKYCTDAKGCGYYTFLQGTSMASPHASGVAALIVSEYGKSDRAHKGTLTLSPDRTEQRLEDSAAAHACPTPRTQTYTNEGRDVTFNATCEGGTSFNGFYGHGIVDANRAVGGRR